jgi:hypothetical protein
MVPPSLWFAAVVSTTGITKCDEAEFASLLFFAISLFRDVSSHFSLQ